MALTDGGCEHCKWHDEWESSETNRAHHQAKRDEAESKNEVLEGRIAKADELHFAAADGFCVECKFPYPCTTVRYLRGEKNG